MLKSFTLFLAAIMLVEPLLATQAEASFWRDRQLARQLSSRPSEARAGIQSLKTKTRFQIGFQPSGMTDAPFIIHIQDIHKNLEAQKNIADVVSSILRTQDSVTLALEGSWTKYPMHLFRTYPYTDALQIVSNLYYQQHRISGPVFAALTSPAEQMPDMAGIEQQDLYEAHVNAFRQAHPLQKQAQHDLQLQLIKLNQEKAAVLNPELAAFDQKLRAFHDGSLALGEFIQVLVSHSQTPSTAIRLFIDSLALENQIDPKSAEKERAVLLSELRRSMSVQQLEELYYVSQSFQRQEIRAAEFYRYLQGLCQISGVQLDRLPHFSRHLRYVLMADQIQPEVLLSDITVLEKKVIEQLAQTPQEKGLMIRTRQLTLTEKLLQFELTPEEWEEYRHSGQAKREPESTDDWIPAFAGMTNLVPFERFYQLTEERDQSMFKNLETLIKRDHPKIVVLVTGGFHTNGMRSLIQEKKWNYQVCRPTITKIERDGHAQYLDAFLREKTPLEKLLQGEKLFLSDNPFPMGPFVKDLADQAAKQSGSREYFKTLKHFRPFLLKNVDRSIRSTYEGVRRYFLEEWERWIYFGDEFAAWILPQSQWQLVGIPMFLSSNENLLGRYSHHELEEAIRKALNGGDLNKSEISSLMTFLAHRIKSTTQYLNLDKAKAKFESKSHVLTRAGGGISLGAGNVSGNVEIEIFYRSGQGYFVYAAKTYLDGTKLERLFKLNKDGRYVDTGKFLNSTGRLVQNETPSEYTRSADGFERFLKDNAGGSIVYSKKTLSKYFKINPAKVAGKLLRYEIDISARRKSSQGNTPGGVISLVKKISFPIYNSISIWVSGNELTENEYDRAIAPAWENILLGVLFYFLTGLTDLSPPMNAAAWTLFVALHLANFLPEYADSRAPPENSLIAAVFIALLNIALGFSPLHPGSILIHLLINSSSLRIFHRLQPFPIGSSFAVNDERSYDFVHILFSKSVSRERKGRKDPPYRVRMVRKTERLDFRDEILRIWKEGLFKKLTQADRRLLTDYYIRQLSQPKIAELYRQTQSRISQRLFQARLRLSRITGNMKLVSEHQIWRETRMAWTLRQMLVDNWREFVPYLTEPEQKILNLIHPPNESDRKSYLQAALIMGMRHEPRVFELLRRATHNLVRVPVSAFDRREWVKNKSYFSENRDLWEYLPPRHRRALRLLYPKPQWRWYTISEAADFLNVKMEQVNTVLDEARKTIEFNKKLGSDKGFWANHYRFIAQREELLSVLSPEFQQILNLSYGFGGHLPILPPEIAKKLGINLSQVGRLQSLAYQTLEFISAAGRGRPQWIENSKIVEANRSHLRILSADESAVIKLRFPSHAVPLTLEQAGDELGFTREWVRILEGRAIQKLKERNFSVTATVLDWLPVFQRLKKAERFSPQWQTYFIYVVFLAPVWETWAYQALGLDPLIVSYAARDFADIIPWFFVAIAWSLFGFLFSHYLPDILKKKFDHSPGLLLRTFAVLLFAGIYLGFGYWPTVYVHAGWNVLMLMVGGELMDVTRLSPPKNKPKELSNSDWKLLIYFRTPWKKVSKEGLRFVVRAVFQAARKRRGIKLISELKLEDFLETLPLLGKGLGGLFNEFSKKPRPRNISVIQIMLRNLGLLPPPIKLSDVRTLSELAELVKQGQFSRGRMARIPWTDLRKSVLREILLEAARVAVGIPMEKFKAMDPSQKRLLVLQMEMRVLKKIKITNADIRLQGLYDSYVQRQDKEKIPKTPRWMLLEDAGLLPSTLPSLSQLNTTADLKYLIDCQALSLGEGKAYIPWITIQKFNPKFLGQIFWELAAYKKLKLEKHDDIIRAIENNQVTQEDLFQLTREDFWGEDALILPGLDSNLMMFYSYLTRITPEGKTILGYGISTFILSGESLRYDRAYSVTKFQALRRKRGLPRTLWFDLPKSVMRELFYSLFKAALIKRTNLRELTDITHPQVKRIIVSAHGSTLHGLYAHFRGEGPWQKRVIEGLNFSTSLERMKFQLGLIRKNLSEERLRELGLDVAAYAGMMGPEKLSKTALHRRRISLEKMLEEIDRKLDDPQVQVKKELNETKAAIEAQWALLDTYEWIPSIFIEVLNEGRAQKYNPSRNLKDVLGGDLVRQILRKKKPLGLEVDQLEVEDLINVLTRENNGSSYEKERFYFLAINHPAGLAQALTSLLDTNTSVRSYLIDPKRKGLLGHLEKTAPKKGAALLEVLNGPTHQSNEENGLSSLDHRFLPMQQRESATWHGVVRLLELLKVKNTDEVAVKKVSWWLESLVFMAGSVVVVVILKIVVGDWAENHLHAAGYLGLIAGLVLNVLFTVLHWKGFYAAQQDGSLEFYEFDGWKDPALKKAWTRLFNRGIIFHGPFILTLALSPVISWSSLAIVGLMSLAWAAESHRLYNVDAAQPTVHEGVYSAASYGHPDVNEDNFSKEDFYDGRLQLRAVYDGLKGHGHGDFASRIAKEAIEKFVKESLHGIPFEELSESKLNVILSMAMDYAHQRIREESLKAFGLNAFPMTAGTVAFIWQRPRGRWRILAAQSGDTRLYVAPKGKPIELLTLDNIKVSVDWDNQRYLSRANRYRRQLLENSSVTDLKAGDAYVMERPKGIRNPIGAPNLKTFVAPIFSATYKGAIAPVLVSDGAGDMYTPDQIHQLAWGDLFNVRAKLRKRQTESFEHFKSIRFHLVPIIEFLKDFSVNGASQDPDFMKDRMFQLVSSDEYRGSGVTLNRFADIACTIVEDLLERDLLTPFEDREEILEHVDSIQSLLRKPYANLTKVDDVTGLFSQLPDLRPLASSGKRKKDDLGSFIVKLENPDGTSQDVEDLQRMIEIIEGRKRRPPYAYQYLTAALRMLGHPNFKNHAEAFELYLKLFHGMSDMINSNHISQLIELMRNNTDVVRSFASLFITSTLNRAPKEFRADHLFELTKVVMDSYRVGRFEECNSLLIALARREDLARLYGVPHLKKLLKMGGKNPVDNQIVMEVLGALSTHQRIKRLIDADMLAETILLAGTFSNPDVAINNAWSRFVDDFVKGLNPDRGRIFVNGFLRGLHESFYETDEKIRKHWNNHLVHFIYKITFSHIPRDESGKPALLLYSKFMMAWFDLLRFRTPEARPVRSQSPVGPEFGDKFLKSLVPVQQQNLHEVIERLNTALHKANPNLKWRLKRYRNTAEYRFVDDDAPHATWALTIRFLQWMGVRDPVHKAVNHVSHWLESGVFAAGVSGLISIVAVLNAYGISPDPNAWIFWSVLVYFGYNAAFTALHWSGVWVPLADGTPIPLRFQGWDDPVRWQMWKKIYLKALVFHSPFLLPLIFHSSMLGMAPWGLLMVLAFMGASLGHRKANLLTAKQPAFNEAHASISSPDHDNEDSQISKDFFNKRVLLRGVVDAMGGLPDGVEAAAAVVKAVESRVAREFEGKRFDEIDNAARRHILREATLDAHDMVLAQTNGGVVGSFGFITQESNGDLEFLISHSGDTRAYIIVEGEPAQLLTLDNANVSVDWNEEPSHSSHWEVNRYFRNADAGRDDYRVRNYLGGSIGFRPSLYSLTIKRPMKKVKIVFVTDGVTDTTSIERLEAAVDLPPSEMVEEILQMQEFSRKHFDALREHLRPLAQYFMERYAASFRLNPDLMSSSALGFIFHRHYYYSGPVFNDFADEAVKLLIELLADGTETDMRRKSELLKHGAQIRRLLADPRADWTKVDDASIQVIEWLPPTHPFASAVPTPGEVSQMISLLNSANPKIRLPALAQFKNVWQNNPEVITGDHFIQLFEVVLRFRGNPKDNENYKLLASFADDDRFANIYQKRHINRILQKMFLGEKYWDRVSMDVLTYLAQHAPVKPLLTHNILERVAGALVMHEDRGEALLWWEKLACNLASGMDPEDFLLLQNSLLRRYQEILKKNPTVEARQQLMFIATFIVAAIEYFNDPEPNKDNRLRLAFQDFYIDLHQAHWFEAPTFDQPIGDIGFVLPDQSAEPFQEIESEAGLDFVHSLGGNYQESLRKAVHTINGRLKTDSPKLPLKLVKSAPDGFYQFESIKPGTGPSVTELGAVPFFLAASNSSLTEIVLGIVLAVWLFTSFYRGTRGSEGFTHLTELPDGDDVVAWVENEEEARSLIAQRLKPETSGRLVLAYPSGEVWARNLAPVAGRLFLTEMNGASTLLTLTQSAKDLLNQRKGTRFHLLMKEGARLPSGFFDLSSQEWTLFYQQARLYLLKRMLGIIEVPMRLHEKLLNSKKTLQNA